MPKKQELVEVDKDSFENFIASLEGAKEALADSINQGYELLGIEVAGEEGAAEEGSVDLDDLDLDGLIDLAESENVELPRKTIAKGEKAVREFIAEALGAEETGEEEPGEEEPGEGETGEGETGEEEPTIKVRKKLKAEIAKKTLPAKKKKK